MKPRLLPVEDSVADFIGHCKGFEDSHRAEDFQIFVDRAEAYAAEPFRHRLVQLYGGERTVIVQNYFDQCLPLLGNAKPLLEHLVQKLISIQMISPACRKSIMVLMELESRSSLSPHADLGINYE
jgi:hypothetical protein